jgi:hypothetical protein
MCNEPICKCGYDSCLNGGLFVPSSCSCICRDPYNGYRCESLITSTNRPCAIKSCNNGGKLNANSCSCECKNSKLLEKSLF